MKQSRLLGTACACLIAGSPLSTAHAGLLYAVEESSDTLISIDTDTFTTTSIGSLGVSFNFGGMAYDPNSDTLYMIDGQTSNSSLYTVNRTTGQATLIGASGANSLFGLAFDSTNNVLYGSQLDSPRKLYSLDTMSGSATNIDPMDGGMSAGIGGLAYDSNRDMLVGILDGSGALYDIDRSTGDQTFLATTATNNSGLAYDSDQDLFWDIDFSGNLYSYDPNNSYAQTKIILPGLGAHDGLAYVSSVPVPAAIWLFGSGLIGLVSIMRRRKV
jgi:uncharacterized protein YjiK